MILDRKLSSPTTANLELTEKCNARCLHCYNPWREEHMGINSFDISRVKKSLDKLKEARIFHVVFTGGEPMSNLMVLEEALRYGSELGFSFSCNSNLMLTSQEKMKKLRSLGLDHILTSFPSIDEEENDNIMQVKNSVKKIKRGILDAIQNDIRVSVNMVFNKKNYLHVYKTAKFISELGCQKFFITRAVPPVYSYNEKSPDVGEEYKMTHEETKQALDQAIKARDDFGLMIGSLVSYPICFLGDLEKYKDFVGRGCPSQRGHRLNINATGDLHVCVHEEKEYGNMFESSISDIYQTKMRHWQEKEKMIYEGCKGCEYISTCYSGCQMIALAYNGKLGTKDPLFVGPNSVTKKYIINDDYLKEFEKLIQTKKDLKLKINPNLRFRKEKGFYLVNTKWANTFTLKNEIGKFLENNIGKDFFLNEVNYSLKIIALLILKEAIITDEIQIDEDLKMKGLSVNLESLPYFKDILNV